MDFDPRLWGSDEWGLAVTIVGLLFAFVQPFGFLLQWRKDSEDRLEKNAKLRANWAAQLRSGSAGTVYRHALSRALDWLDRVFGPSGSAQALGLCFLVAVAYAWVTFFVGWGFFHASGGVGGKEFLPKDATEVQRIVGGALAIILPPAMFYSSRWLTRWTRIRERRLQAWLLKRWPRRGFPIGRRALAGLAFIAYWAQIGERQLQARPLNHWPRRLRRWGFPISWRIALVGLVFVGIYWIWPKRGNMGSETIRIVFFMFFVLFASALAGRWANRFFSYRFYAGIASFLVGALAGALVSALALALALASASVLPLIIAVAFAFVGIVADGTTRSVAVAVAVAMMTAIGAGLGMVRHEQDRRGLWAGGLGGITGMGVLGISMGSTNSNSFLVILFLLFFLILPLVNSLFDWLSWWATRALGRRLLDVLEPARSFWWRLLAVLGHGFLDLGAAVALLLSMAFALGLGFQVYNDLSVLHGEAQTFKDLPGMIQAAAKHPWTEGFWLTLMLLTTLLPTFGHGIMLLGSPLGLMLLPDGKRLQLAEELELYNAADSDEQADIRYRAARWHVQERLASWLLGGALFFWLLVRFWVLVPIGLADWAAGAAKLGVQAAGWLVGAK